MHKLRVSTEKSDRKYQQDAYDQIRRTKFWLVEAIQDDNFLKNVALFKARYQMELINAGFERTEALEIVKSMDIPIPQERVSVSMTVTDDDDQ